MPNYGTTNEFVIYDSPYESSGSPVRVRKPSLDPNEESLIFIHNPKTAGSSISNWLHNLSTRGYVYEKMNAHYSLKTTRGYWKEPAVTFCVVRNPFSRYVSFWSYDMKSKTEEETDFRSWFWTNFDTVSRQQDYFDGCDIILKYENLEEDFKQIQERVKYYAPLPKINVSADYRDKHPSSYYDSDMYSAVKEREKVTFEKFGYLFTD